MKETRSSKEVRASFLEFFRSKGHEIVPSSPVVLPNDPTLLFTNAGMNQFKDVFLGRRDSIFKRVANTQKCIRVSGKHNDLEEVGHDTYHHTFFEMLGNWSFGDYYKREAIAWAWELLTSVWGLPKNRLWATVYRTDDEAARLWREVTDIDPARILPFGEKDNFWEMGDTGPCGPCSEIHIDLSDNGYGSEMVNVGSPEVIELWNLVFIQYTRQSDGSLVELPSKHVDTGMGLERVAAVLQGKRSNYDSDIFQPLIKRLEQMSGRTYAGEDAVAMRVIADHLRTLAFAVADGVLPSNDGRGYVLRRLLRRAFRYGRKLSLQGPFLGELFPVLESSMGSVFPEISRNRASVLRALRTEEEGFAATIERGLGLFDDVVTSVKKSHGGVFPGEEAFRLYDTYGFPLDLTMLMAVEQGLKVDQSGFDQAMAKQRERARAARKDVNLEVLTKASVFSGKECEFVGYRELTVKAKVVAFSGFDGDVLQSGLTAGVVLDKTPFYGESGGQVGDIGVLETAGGKFVVKDTRKTDAGLIVHFGELLNGDLKIGAEVNAKVDQERRASLQRHHTATHLLNYALRFLVSGSIKQAGSYVCPDYLRFDFNHYEPLGQDKLEELELLVNKLILRNLPVSTYQLAMKEVAGSDIVAVFDEKYGDRVRVVDIQDISRELCGGTHVDLTGDIGCFRIVAESSIAAGVRRIEAVCGLSAYSRMCADRNIVRELAQVFSSSADEVVGRVSALIEINKKLEKESKLQTEKMAKEEAVELLSKAEVVNGVPVIAVAVGERSPDYLRLMIETLRPKLEPGLIVLGGVSDQKVCFVASASDDLVKRGFHAGRLIGEVAKMAGGGGGGQPGRAQAGGRDPSKLDVAIEKAKQLIFEFLR